MNNLKKSTYVAFNLSKSLIYSLEYKMLYQISNAFSFLVKPPKAETNKLILDHLEKNVLTIHKEDAQNIIEGYYPAAVLMPKAPREHILKLPKLIFDSLKISRRRKMNIKNDLQENREQVPDYFNRNFHFQTDGYFSEHSASLYEHQVEVLFSGTAAPMRRMLIKFIKDKMKTDRPLKILELGAGVGTASIDFSKSFNISSYVVSDASSSYLDLAKTRMTNPKIQFVKAYGEDLPFGVEEFDLVFSVYLFHELPRSVREKVIVEAKRVLKKEGVFAFCDSIQKDDDPILNEVLENFPKDYHEPFYKDYTIWKAGESLEASGFKKIESHYRLLSKYWLATT